MEELKRLRKAKGLSQAKLAALADLDPSTVSQIETGARRANMRTLERLATALGAEVGDLFPLDQAPLPDLEDERRGPSLQSWIDLVNRLADRWEREIEEREQEWQDAKPVVRKMVKRLPNLVWVNEIRETATAIVDVTVGELERDALVYDPHDVVGLLHAARRLDRVIERTRPWYDTAAEDAPKVAQVYDFQEALKRMESMEKRARVRAS